jgi:hypothetical protein
MLTFILTRCNNLNQRRILCEARNGQIVVALARRTGIFSMTDAEKTQMTCGLDITAVVLLAALAALAVGVGVALIYFGYFGLTRKRSLINTLSVTARRTKGPIPMSVIVNYGMHYPWNRPNPHAPSDNRPYAEIVLKGPNNSPRIWCLVDSGADFILLDKSFANTAGIVLGAGATQIILTASGGSVSVQQLQNIDFVVEGTSLKDTCLFGTNSISILGRVTFLRAFDVGFDKKGWMRT